MAITIGAGLKISDIPIVITLVAGLVALALAAATVYFNNRFAGGVLVRLLGDTGTKMTLRMYSFILLCIGVQVMWDGIGRLLLQLRAMGL
ncbi:MAG: hypothetical protein H7240_01270 [Glaciimonas sp.]|nr:hypothetical protein [Glaciimonas sp.]